MSITSPNFYVRTSLFVGTRPMTTSVISVTDLIALPLKILIDSNRRRTENFLESSDLRWTYETKTIKCENVVNKKMSESRIDEQNEEPVFL